MLSRLLSRRLLGGIMPNAGGPGASSQRMLAVICTFFVMGLLASLSAATLPVGFTETQIAAGLSNPTAMAFAPDGRLFVCLQGGQLRVIKNGALLATPFLTVTVDATGERGLLGVTFDPDFANNQFVYVYYTATTPALHNRVSRFTGSGDVAASGSEVIVLELNNLSAATNHNGGAIHFGPDGKLYIGVGENALPSNAQTLSNLLGKILRISPDGAIPADNPFFGSATGNNRAIWALGLRNPYTFAFQPATGRMFINDVGQAVWEEINDGLAGSNYGWPTCEGGCSPANPSFRDPLFQYGHGSSATTGCAITGGAFYNPPTSQFPSEYTGQFFFADFCTGWIRRFDPTTKIAVDFASGIASPVDLQVAADGSLYYLAHSGAVFRINSTQSPPNSFQFDKSSYAVNESLGLVTITVTRSGDNTVPATVDYLTTDGSASGHGDYTATAATLRFAPGETSRTFNILISDDNYVEGDETVNTSLSNASGGPALGTPGSAILVINDNDSTPPASNPADDAGFFVRQQYYDFLSREPDQDGFDYWTSQITQCGTDVMCIHNRRVAVSDAFFFEPEFQETGTYIYRIYKASFAGPPSYAQFTADRSRVIGGPQLDQSKTDFASVFVQRPSFIAQHPQSLTPGQYVDALNLATGNSLTQSQRDALVSGLMASPATETRGSVLRKIAENQVFIDREYNAVFVLMEYFAYLRRDPEQEGFDFWFDQLRRCPIRNVGAQHALVCSFLTSREYQERFSSVVSRTNAQCPQGDVCTQ
jgi:glucose/arabinose dehydrogenase